MITEYNGSCNGLTGETGCHYPRSPVLSVENPNNGLPGDGSNIPRLTAIAALINSSKLGKNIVHSGSSGCFELAKLT